MSRRKRRSGKGRWRRKSRRRRKVRERRGEGHMKMRRRKRERYRIVASMTSLTPSSEKFAGGSKFHPCPSHTHRVSMEKENSEVEKRRWVDE